MSNKNGFAGNVLAALLGIITPFCSCSAVPLFIGFVTAGVPLGVTFSFLIATCMVFCNKGRRGAKEPDDWPQVEEQEKKKLSEYMGQFDLDP